MDFLEDHIKMSPARHQYDTVVASHLIEHFEADDQVLLLELIYDFLPPGGRMVIVTPNLRNPVVAAENFWLDTDHKRPMPLPLLYRLSQEIGFTVVAAGACWPWQSARFRREMRRAGHNVSPHTTRRKREILAYYLRKVLHYGPQLNLLRGDTWLVADKR